MFSEHLHKKPSEREYCKNCTLPAYSKVLDEIVKIHKQGCLECPMLEICKQCTHSCGEFKTELIIQKIKEVKEGAQSNTDGNQHQ